MCYCSQHIKAWGLIPCDNKWKQFPFLRPRKEENPLWSGVMLLLIFAYLKHVWVFTDAGKILFYFIHWTGHSVENKSAQFTDGENDPIFFGRGGYRSARLSKFMSQVKKDWKSVSACVNRKSRCICVSTLAKLTFLAENSSTHIWCLHPTSFHTSKGTAWTPPIWASVPDIYRKLWRWTESWIWQCRHILITRSRTCEVLFKGFRYSEVINLSRIVQVFHIWAVGTTIN